MARCRNECGKMLRMRFSLGALFLALAIDLQGWSCAENPSSGVPPIPSDGRNIIHLRWSEVDHAAMIEIEQQKFASPDQIAEVVHARLKSDPATHFLVLYKRAV